MSKTYQPDVVQRDPAELTSYAHNAKTHPDEQIDKIAGSIAEYGFDQPIVVDADGVIIKGHGRRLAAVRLGLTSVPVIVRDDLTPAQVKAARLLDNKSAESDWDLDQLVIDLQALKDDEFAGPLGFDENEVASILANALGEPGGMGDGDVPEPPATPVSKTGDLWLLDDHRLLCGDSTEDGDVKRLMNGERAILFATDPPAHSDENGQRFRLKAATCSDPKRPLLPLVFLGGVIVAAEWFVDVTFLPFGQCWSDLFYRSWSFALIAHRGRSCVRYG